MINQILYELYLLICLKNFHQKHILRKSIFYIKIKDYIIAKIIYHKSKKN